MVTAAQREVFRRALRQAREDAGLTQRALARAVSVSAGAVWQWERDQDGTVPRLDMTTRLEIGSVAASVLSDPLARALFVTVTAAVDITDAQVHDYRARNPGRFGSDSEIADHLLGAAKRRAFRLWLDARCAELVELAPGYEHPGDPRQPDNTHRH